jgi:hypothetical protein
LKLPTAEQKNTLAKLKNELAAAEEKLKTAEDNLAAEQGKWESSVIPSADPPDLLLRFGLDGTIDGEEADGGKVTGSFQGTNSPGWTARESGKGLTMGGRIKCSLPVESPVNLELTNAFSCGCWVKVENEGADTLFGKLGDEQPRAGFDLSMSKDRLSFDLIQARPDKVVRISSKKKLPRDEWMHVFATYDGSSKTAGVKLYIDGKESELETAIDDLSGTIRNDAPFSIGNDSDAAPLKGAIADVRVYGRVLKAEEVAGLADAPAVSLARLPEAKRTAEQKKYATDYFRDHHYPTWTDAKKAVEAARTAREDFEKTIPSTMVMSEMAKPRDSFVLTRGQYDKQGAKVTAGVPESFGSLPEGAPANRLGLAEWLVSPAQPLTARVIVNRFWQVYFGTGLVKTAEDFGL